MSKQLLMNSPDCSCCFVICISLPTCLKATVRQSRTLNLKIFMAMYNKCCGVTPHQSDRLSSLVDIMNNVTRTLSLKVRNCPRYIFGNDNSSRVRQIIGLLDFVLLPKLFADIYARSTVMYIVEP